MSSASTRTTHRRKEANDGIWHELDNIGAEATKQVPAARDFSNAFYALSSAAPKRDSAVSVATAEVLDNLAHLNQTYSNGPEVGLVPEDGLGGLYAATPIGPGCGLFFEGRYFGQLNLILEGLDEKEVLGTLSKTFGAHREIQRTSSYSKYAGGAHAVYVLDSTSTLVLLLVGENRLATLYLDTEQTERIPARASEALAAAERKAREAEAAARRAKTKAHLGDL